MNDRPKGWEKKEGTPSESKSGRKKSQIKISKRVGEGCCGGEVEVGEGG